MFGLVIACANDNSQIVLDLEECRSGFALFLLESVGKKCIMLVAQPALFDLFTINAKNDKMNNVTILANFQLNKVRCSVNTQLFDRNEHRCLEEDVPASDRFK
ncbi:hypothetical protein MFLAVUS_007660 [Mucor flavus]|uniref:Uncharacterized protein n=1 Tax=Mucor flavus TaxID=439312 RepID=A0ABP9Z532_9FUNG